MTLQFLFWAYTLIWILLAAYLAILGLRQHALARRLERLRERLEGRAGGSGRANE